jgi:type VI secretion system protein ImpC
VTFDPAAALAALERIIEEQLSAIMQHPELVALERAWRSVAFLIERIDWSRSIQLAIVQCSKDELAADFEAGGDAMFGWCHRDTFEIPGGEPYGLCVADYEIDASESDVALATACATVGADCHMPVFIGAAPSRFGLETYQQLVDDPNALRKLAQDSGHGPHAGLRESHSARFLGLCLPRMQLRPGLWGNAAVGLASRCADSFARYSWCPNIVGHEGGRLKGVTAELGFDEETEYHVAEAGYVCLSSLPDGDACFLAANSVQRRKLFEQSEVGRDKELNFLLMSQLPYSFITCRLAQYVKVVARDNADLWQTAAELQSGLNGWLATYVADAHVVTPETRGLHPLRKVKIDVTPTDDGARFELKTRPHFKFHGAFFILDARGTLPTGPASPARRVPTQEPALSFDDMCGTFIGNGELLVASTSGQLSRYTLETQDVELLFGNVGRVCRIAADADGITLGIYAGYNDELERIERRHWDGSTVDSCDVPQRPRVHVFGPDRVLITRYRHEDGRRRTLMLLDPKDGSVRDLEFEDFRTATVDERRVAFCLNSRQVVVRTLDDEQKIVLPRQHGASALAFSPDGGTLASGTGALHLWDLETGEARTFHADGEPITAIAFSPSEPLVACAADGQIQVWSLDGELLQRLQCPEHYVSQLSFAGGWLLGQTRGPSLHVWKLS